ncbi:MAG: hypothetical protein DMF82_00540 [Acidobacteria bacterium]|nr:MAG: hypothetical protein DMF82_00540 [Acidobacteriota bacterium]
MKADDFSHLLEGHDPSGDQVLVPHREGLSERRAGWDVTISPHKGVSLAALVGAAGRAGMSRAAGLEAGRGGVKDRPAPAGRRPADDGSHGRDGRAAPEREGGSRTLAGDRLASGDVGRWLSGGSNRQLALWLDGEREAAGSGTRDQRAEERAADAAPDRGPEHQAHDETRALTQEALRREPFAGRRIPSSRIPSGLGRER